MRSSSALRSGNGWDCKLAHAPIRDPRAAALFHWKTLGRQVRIEGPIERLTPEQSQAYYDTRPRGLASSAWPLRLV